ncbi:MAG: manganese efflux pump [Candidatus Micrarchaeota archaeon]
MDISTSILIGIGLAMDCSAVSMAGGIGRKADALKAAALAGLFFGAFQGGMLFLGGLGGESLKAAVSGIDHWIAFSALALVGGKMLLESRQKQDEGRIDLLDAKILLFLAIATSIDALAVGVGIAFVGDSVIGSALVIGATTAFISFSSVFIGQRYGASLENKAEIFGGVVLVLIGLNILLSHLSG